MPAVRSILGMSAAVGLTAFLVLQPRCAAACDGCCGVYWGTPIVSALDTPLRWYYVPRTPAWGGSVYRYRVKISEPCNTCGPGGWISGDEMCLAGGPAIPPEAANAFDPWEFELLGQIPNDSLLEAAGPATR